MIEFDEAVSTPENWFKQSREMFEASRALYEVVADREPLQSEADIHRRAGAVIAEFHQLAGGICKANSDCL